MTRIERLVTASSVRCCACDRLVSVQELEEFLGLADDGVTDAVHCRRCAEARLHLCRECSGRYTAEDGGVCSACAGRWEDAPPEPAAA